MFHAAATATGGFADVEDEGVLIVGRAFHQFDFVHADFAEGGFDVAAFVVVAVDDDVDGGSEVVDGEFFEVGNFDGVVGEGVVRRSGEIPAIAACTHGTSVDRRCRGHFPLEGNVREQEVSILRRDDRGRTAGSWPD